MARRNTPQFQEIQAAQAEPYLGEYSRLAEQFLRGKNKPIYSVGQGIAELASDLGSAYFLKEAAKKEQEKAVADNRAMAKALSIASDTDMTRSQAAQMGGQGQSIAQQVFSPGSNETDRYRAAVNALAGTNPEMAVAGTPALMQMARASQPAAPQYTSVEGVGLVRIPERGEPSVALEAQRKSSLLTPAEEAQQMRLRSAGASAEPLVEVADPNDPTRGVMVPRSQAAGRSTVQTIRERMPRVKTYYDESGNPITLDANDPIDQKSIKDRNLVESAPTEAERTSKGYLDRLVAAEPIMQGLVDAGYDPANFRDKAAQSVIFGNYAVSDQGQQFRQAQEDWVRAKLRKESGAVIADEEMEREIRTYFPQPGDSKKTIEQKTQSRKQAERQLAISAGVLGRGYLRGTPAPQSAGTEGVPQGVDPGVWKFMTPEERALWSK